MQYYSNSTVLSYYNTSMAIVHGMQLQNFQHLQVHKVRSGGWKPTITSKTLMKTK